VKELRDNPADETILRWDDLGVDMLMVDEVHNFKNLATPSNNEELAESGSKRASDLLLKLEIMRRTAQEGSGRAGVVLASGTPVANRVAEMYVMQKFLQPDVLATAEVEGFDTWAASFGKVVSKMELNTTGTTYQMKSRFAGYQNVGDLMRMALAHFDFVMSDDLDLPRPAVRGGGARIIEVPESAAMAELMACRWRPIRSCGFTMTTPTPCSTTTTGTPSRCRARCRWCFVIWAYRAAQAASTPTPNYAP